MERFKTTTPKKTEGFNVSYNDEKCCGEILLKLLPKDWCVSFSWSQIAMHDVAYHINEKKQEVEINYNQNLCYWWQPLMKEIEGKLKDLEIIS